MTASALLADLNPRQREAVEHTEGPLLVLAGAGSGKTRVITRRIAYLIRARQVPARAILAMTFTNKAAGEMQERVAAAIGGQAPPAISTFHAFCVRALRADYAAVGGRRDFVIYAEDEQLALIKAIAKQLGIDDKQLPPRAVLARISRAKNEGRGPEAMLEKAADPRSERVAVIYERYQKALAQANALDFDDLLLETERMLRQSPEVAERLNERYQYVHVDEYQDTNRPQYQLMKQLTAQRRNLCVVGDEDQSIYSWRGADLRNILDFERDFPAARVVRLEQNYRSTRNILDAASAVVANNVERKGKTLWTEADAGAAVGHYLAPDGENEALWVADALRRQLAREPRSQAAILYRTNAQSRPFEEALRRYDLRYKVVGGFSFYERAEIKDLLAYLKAAANPADSVAVLRIITTPPRGIGRATLDLLEREAAAAGAPLLAALARLLDAQPTPLPPRAAAALADFRELMDELHRLAAANARPRELLRLVLERTGYARLLEREDTPEAEARLENLGELLNAAADSAERGESLAEFLDHAALVNEQDDYDAEIPITLMTLHAAKGLEFSTVFLVGMEDGLFPHARTLASPRELEEERRLCYVGMTRARERLVLTRAAYRRRYGAGSLEATLPSRFLREVPSALIEDLSPRAAAEAAEAEPAARGPRYVRQGYSQEAAPPAWHAAPPPSRAAAGLRPGVRVRHQRFGAGTVLRVEEGEAGDRKITVSFPGYGLKKMLERYAGLETLGG